MIIIADDVMPSRNACGEVKHTVLSSRMLSPLFPPMRDHMESISTSSALSGFTYMATMGLFRVCISPTRVSGDPQCNSGFQLAPQFRFRSSQQLRMEARVQSADSLTEICMQ